MLFIVIKCIDPTKYMDINAIKMLIGVISAIKKNQFYILNIY